MIRVRELLFLGVATGCGGLTHSLQPVDPSVDAWSASAGGEHAPPTRLLITPVTLWGGRTNYVYVYGAAWGDVVHLAMSPLGPGTTCPPPLGGSCLDMPAPALVGSAETPIYGYSFFRVSAPESMIGRSVFLQAAYADGADSVVSNRVTADIVRVTFHTGRTGESADTGE
jgi:hypothetical protein